MFMAANVTNRRIQTTRLLVAGCSALGALGALVWLQNPVAASGKRPEETL
jgi:hypothetical protein